MNLKKTVKELNRTFKSWGINFDVNIEKTKSGNETVKATASLTLKGVDDDIFANFHFYPSGACEYLFTFDKLSKNAQTLDLANTFNEESIWFKAYIDDEYLRLSHIVFHMTEDKVAEYTDRILTNLADDDLKEWLLPLTDLTVS